MVNNPININKINNHLSPEIIEQKESHDIWRWKSMSWQETDKSSGGV
jgi:hypothetical protein